MSLTPIINNYKNEMLMERYGYKIETNWFSSVLI